MKASDEIGGLSALCPMETSFVEQRPLLRMQGVRKRFGATVALDGVDLAVDRGEVLALVGEA